MRLIKRLDTLLLTNQLTNTRLSLSFSLFALLARVHSSLWISHFAECERSSFFLMLCLLYSSLLSTLHASAGPSDTTNDTRHNGTFCLITLHSPLLCTKYDGSIISIHRPVNDARKVDRQKSLHLLLHLRSWHGEHHWPGAGEKRNKLLWRVDEEIAHHPHRERRDEASEWSRTQGKIIASQVERREKSDHWPAKKRMKWSRRKCSLRVSLSLLSLCELLRWGE